jgi:hypothetical protein
MHVNTGYSDLIILTAVVFISTVSTITSTVTPTTGADARSSWTTPELLARTRC